jgi:hypothetical protein
MMATPALKRFWHPDPKAKHQRVSHDLTIAAIAITYDTPILTTDSDFEDIHRHFSLPGVYNPLTEEWLVEARMPIELPGLRPDAPAIWQVGMVAGTSRDFEILYPLSRHVS